MTVNNTIEGMRMGIRMGLRKQKESVWKYLISISQTEEVYDTTDELVKNECEDMVIGESELEGEIT